MNGAEALLRTAGAGGIEVCFANAGTTEMPIVMALDAVPGIRPVLGLFEGVCTGAADGYGRLKGSPAMTLLHLGPGLGNGIANLHNARRAGTPIFNVIGDHASWHLAADAPLTMDIAALAGTVSGWQRQNAAAAELPQDTALAIAAARSGMVATLVVPVDHQGAACPEAPAGIPPFAFAPPDHQAVAEAACFLRTATRPLLILGGRALSAPGLTAAARIRAAVGCDLLVETFPAVMARGAGLPAPAKIPYFPDHAVAVLKPYDQVLLAGARPPVAFFGYEGLPGRLLGEEQRRLRLDGEGQDAAAALTALADFLAAPADGESLRDVLADYRRPELPAGKLTAEKAGLVLAALQPEGAVIVEEALTSGFSYFTPAAQVAPHTYVTITGGAIGQGLPCATGAALACPDRRVIAFQADGSAMYTLQALWTQARESLNVTTLICANRGYQILQVEMLRAGYLSPGPGALYLTELGKPCLDWVQISRGMGVPAVAVATAEDLARELSAALASPGPRLIEMVL